jgi:hypothetical protein
MAIRAVSAQIEKNRFGKEYVGRAKAAVSRSDPMPNPLTDIPDALDTAIAASLQARREKLVRRVRNQRIRMYVALGLSGCVALFALAAYLIGDYAAARFSAMTACIVFAFTCITGLAARKRAVDALREADQPR